MTTPSTTPVYSQRHMDRMHVLLDQLHERSDRDHIELVEELTRCRQAIAAARRALARGNPELARVELEGVELPDWLEVPGRST